MSDNTIRVHIWALWAAILLNFFTYAYEHGDFNKDQYLIPQGVVICDTMIAIDLVEKNNITPGEWDYIQKQAFLAYKKCK